LLSVQVDLTKYLNICERISIKEAIPKKCFVVATGVTIAEATKLLFPMSPSRKK
jgi:hypothetical protein